MQQRYLLQTLLLAQHVSGTTMPIIRSSRVLYSGCCLWYFTKLLFTFYSKKYHRQQPLYNTHELLMMGVVVPETCRASNKVCNKNLCCIYLAFYFHVLMKYFVLNIYNISYRTRKLNSAIT